MYHTIMVYYLAYLLACQHETLYIGFAIEVVIQPLYIGFKVAREGQIDIFSSM